MAALNTTSNIKSAGGYVQHDKGKKGSRTNPVERTLGPKGGSALGKGDTPIPSSPLTTTALTATSIERHGHKMVAAVLDAHACVDIRLITRNRRSTCVDFDGCVLLMTSYA